MNDLQSSLAAQRKHARPEPNGGHRKRVTHPTRAANGDGRANAVVIPNVLLPAVANPIESENGDGHIGRDIRASVAITNGGGQDKIEAQCLYAPAGLTIRAASRGVITKDQLPLPARAKMGMLPNRSLSAPTPQARAIAGVLPRTALPSQAMTEASH